MTSKRLHQYAHEWDVSTLRLIQLANKHNIDYTPSEEEITRLKRAISGFNKLSDNQIRSLEDHLQTSQANEILKEASGILGQLDQESHDQYLTMVSKQIYDTLEEGDLKDALRPESVKEVIMNLGAVQMLRGNQYSADQEGEIPYYLLNHEPELAQGILKRHFNKILEKMPLDTASDFTKIEQALEQAREELYSQCQK